MLRLRAFLIGFGFLVLAPSANAQTDYPVRTIRLVVGSPGGGGLDIVARVVAQKMAEALGQAVVVENKPGASGMVAAAAVAHGQKDGYTFLVASPSEVALVQSLVAKPTYSVEQDLEAVSLFGTTPLAIVATPSLPANTLAELTALSKSKPGTLNFASPAARSPFELTFEYIKLLTGADINSVPYRGMAAAMNDVIAGQVHITVGGVAGVREQVKSGALKVIVVTSDKRTPLEPDWPSMADAGFPGIDTSTFALLLAPSGVPEPVLARIESTMAAVMQMPDMKKRLAELGVVTQPSDRASAKNFLAAETAKYSKIARDANIKPE